LNFFFQKENKVIFKYSTIIDAQQLFWIESKYLNNHQSNNIFQKTAFSAEILTTVWGEVGGGGHTIEKNTTEPPIYESFREYLSFNIFAIQRCHEPDLEIVCIPYQFNLELSISE